MKSKTALAMITLVLLIQSIAFSATTRGADKAVALARQDTPQVELYITSWCPYCRQAVDFFQSRGIPFKVYDIEKDENAARRKNELDSRKGVPFVVINGVKIHGFSEEHYLNALNNK